MSNETFGPQDPHLTDLLRRNRPSPALPPRFQEGVWNRIELAEAAEGAVTTTWFEILLDRVLKPRLVLAAVTAVVMVSALAGVVNGSVSAKYEARARYVASVAPATVR